MKFFETDKKCKFTISKDTYNELKRILTEDIDNKIIEKLKETEEKLKENNDKEFLKLLEEMDSKNIGKDLEIND